MPKVVMRLTLLAGLVLMGLASVWLVFADRPEPAQAKEEIIATFHHPANPGARPALAGFNITVNEIIASGFVNPVQLTHAGDGSNRLFVVEQDGRIRIINSPVITPFLDITNTVRSGGEEGLLGLAFHPNYETNGYFYVYYNNNDGDIAIVRYSVSNNPNIANPLSATPVLTIPHPTYSNHNGGQLAFGPLDGYLYISTGDGGNGNDRPNNAQNINVLLGKILRLNVTGVVPTYTIPFGNPFAGATPGADEVWDFGLRNPWRFSFDRGDSNGNGRGDLYIGDVGQGQREEISYHGASTLGGVNFGWRCKEGTRINTDNSIHLQPPCNNPTFLAGLTDPIAEYIHSLGNAVTGGFVYRGSLYPALAGYYFYADYGSGRIWSMTKTGPNSWSTPEEELHTGFPISAFGEDEQGELYVVDYSGNIRRLADANGPNPNLSTSSKSASAPSADPGETLTYTILLKNTGAPTNQPVNLTDNIPSGLVYFPGSLTATQGSVDDSLNPTLRWQGAFSPSANITLTYQVTATGAMTGILPNQAVLTGSGLNSITLTHSIFVPRAVPIFLPVIYKQ